MMIDRLSSSVQKFWRSLKDDATHSTILCLYTGEKIPDFCAKMPRDPEPEVSFVFEHDFAEHYKIALDINQSIHDGVIMIGRTDINRYYCVSGWSYRLLPPSISNLSYENRGSAFNSCLEMSLVKTVDTLYLLSHREMIQFKDGHVTYTTEIHTQS